MAFQDILDSIRTHGDDLIAAARAEHRTLLADMRTASQETIAQMRGDVARQRDAKIAHMRTKAENHVTTHRRNAALSKKRELLSRLYASVLERLASLPDAEIEPLLRSCLAKIDGPGVIRPAKKHAKLLTNLVRAPLTLGEEIDAAGGFLFVSDTTERDFRFESLVHDLLEPATELEALRTLFPSA